MMALLAFTTGAWAVAVGLVMDFLDFDGVPVWAAGLCLLVGLVVGLTNRTGLA